MNGKGQLGTALQALLPSYKTRKNIVIYHTWNVFDTSEEAQKKCYEEFCRFVVKEEKREIVFISTYSQRENWYTHYKQQAEAYLLSYKKGRVIRLPTLIGKGVCQNFKDGTAKPFGIMELMSINDAAKAVLDIAIKKSLILNHRVKGTLVPATLVYDLIAFGKKLTIESMSNQFDHVEQAAFCVGIHSIFWAIRMRGKP